MTLLFKQILSLSITASILIVAVVVLRMILKKAPKGVRYILWAMVGLRLLVPFKIESPFSVMPSHKEVSAVSNGVSQAVSTVSVESAQTAHSPGVFDILSFVWLTGAVLMLLYMLISFLRVRLMVRESILYKDNVYLCDHVSSPFVLGIISPKIYLNSSISKKESKLIIAHERTHIRHLDNFWKPLGFVLLSVYWFNPLCWLSYFLFVKDIELFCDESVVKTLSKNGKKNYSYALLSCSASKNMVTACPLAFAENSVKTRVKNILSYKKPAVYVVVLSVTLCIVTMLMFMTSPVSAKENDNQNTIVETVAQATEETESQTQPPTEPETNAQSEKATQKPTAHLNNNQESVRGENDFDYRENEVVNDGAQNESFSNESEAENDTMVDSEPKEYSANSINPNTDPDSLSLSSDTGRAEGAIYYVPYFAGVEINSDDI